MNILGIIPARGGSKGIPDKNIKFLNGKPLIAYTIEQAKSSKLLSKFIVSTDSTEITRISKKFGAEVPFLRPNNLAKHDSPSIGYVKHAISFFKDRGIFFDAVCILQPTSPFRPDGVIDRAIKKFQQNDIDTLISVREVPNHYNPHWVFFVDDNKYLKISTGNTELITRRQNLPQAFHRDGAIYIVRTSFLEVSNKLIGKRLIGYVINSPALINIDTEEDWNIAENIIS